jgi:putative ABC transport system ATP-binding protein
MQKTALMTLANIGLSVPAGREELVILHDIALALPAGQSVAITGPSGSGKTSLMMVCAGLQRPTRGEMRFRGERLDALSEDALTLWRQEHVGIVFQNFHLLPSSTALENVMLPLELAGRQDAESQASALLGAVGLGHRLGHLPGQLSGGEQQRVSLARALARKPALLLADEPTGNLDQATGAQVMDLLFSHAREHGTTLLLITHDEKVAARCDRIVHIRDGRIVADDTRDA